MSSEDVYVLSQGSLAAGERAANLMTVIGSAIRNDLDVHAYLDDVLGYVLAGGTDWAWLAPHTWSPAHMESGAPPIEPHIPPRRTTTSG